MPFCNSSASDWFRLRENHAGRLIVSIGLRSAFPPPRRTTPPRPKASRRRRNRRLPRFRDFSIRGLNGLPFIVSFYLEPLPGKLSINALTELLGIKVSSALALVGGYRNWRSGHHECGTSQQLTLIECFH